MEGRGRPRRLLPGMSGERTDLGGKDERRSAAHRGRMANVINLSAACERRAADRDAAVTVITQLPR